MVERKWGERLPAKPCATTTRRRAVSDLAESLARRVRAALGEFDDPDLPVVIVVGKLADRVREAADALEAARADGWQPMETAPKDGTRVLLWYEWHDLPVVGDFRHGRWWSVHSLGGNLAHPNGMDWEEVVRPTYWRPLPAPPDIAKDTGEQS